MRDKETGKLLDRGNFFGSSGRTAGVNDSNLSEIGRLIVR